MTNYQPSQRILQTMSSEWKKTTSMSTTNHRLNHRLYHRRRRLKRLNHAKTTMKTAIGNQRQKRGRAIYITSVGCEGSSFTPFCRKNTLCQRRLTMQPTFRPFFPWKWIPDPGRQAFTFRHSKTSSSTTW